MTRRATGMRQLAERLRRDDAGFSLAETLVALVLIALVFSGLVASIVSGLTSVQKGNAQVAANQLANEVIENLRTQSLAVVAPPDPTTPASNVLPGVTKRGVTYVATITRTWVDSPCNNDGVAPPSLRDYLQLNVEIAWRTKGSATQTLDVDTLRTPLEGEPMPDGTTYAPVQIATSAC